MKTANLRMRTLGIMGLLLMIIFFTSILGYFDADVGLKTKCVTLTIVYTTCIIIWVSETTVNAKSKTVEMSDDEKKVQDFKSE